MSFPFHPRTPASLQRHCIFLLDLHGRTHRTCWYRGTFRANGWFEYFQRWPVPHPRMWEHVESKIDPRPLIFLGWEDEREPFPMVYETILTLATSW